MTRISPKLIALSALLVLAACGSDKAPAGGGPTGAACTLDGDCAAGEVCKDQVCSPAFAGGDVAPGFDAGTGGADTGSSDGAAAADTGGGGSASGETCGACQKDGDCATGFTCVPLLNSTDNNFCVKQCAADAECGPGLLCQQATQAAQKYCVPPTFKCEGCAVTGCAADEKCDFNGAPPTCKKVGGVCSECQLSKDCANGQVCVKQGDSKICAPDCAGGEKCPGNSACTAFDSGIKACAFASDKCCFEASCTTSSACQGCPDKCVAGKCVECTKDGDCTDGSCLLKNFTCQKSKCPDDKPQKLVTGECVACTNDTHCAASSVGPKCIANKCAPSNQNNECSVCQDPYPGCVEINGAWSCVECATDDDCKKKGAGSCSAKTYSCSGTTSGSGPTSGTCKSDADCSAGTTGFKLKCDTGSGLCYDTNGQCDNVTAFCNAKAGSVCKPFDLLGLGGAGGGLPQIPGLPSGGGLPSSSGAGVCSCGTSGSTSGGWDMSICKALSLNSCDCAKDSKSKECDPLGLGSCCQQSSGGGGGNPLSLLACLGQLQNNKPDPACFGGKPCVDLSCLTAMTGGGGGGASSGGGGYCGDPTATGTP